MHSGYWVRLTGLWLSIMPVVMLWATLCQCPLSSGSAHAQAPSPACCSAAAPLPPDGCSTTGECPTPCNHCSLTHLQTPPLWVSRVDFELSKVWINLPAPSAFVRSEQTPPLPDVEVEGRSSFEHPPCIPRAPPVC